MEQEFKIYNSSLNFYSYIRQYVISSVPNIHRDVRIHLLDETYSLIRLIYQASYSKGNIRMKYLTDTMVTISMIDMLAHLLIDLCPSNKKHIITSIKFLTDVKNMVYAWKSNEEKK